MNAPIRVPPMSALDAAALLSQDVVRLQTQIPAPLHGSHAVAWSAMLESLGYPSMAAFRSYHCSWALPFQSDRVDPTLLTRLQTTVDRHQEGGRKQLLYLLVGQTLAIEATEVVVQMPEGAQAAATLRWRFRDHSQSASVRVHPDVVRVLLAYFDCPPAGSGRFHAKTRRVGVASVQAQTHPVQPTLTVAAPRSPSTGTLLVLRCSLGTKPETQADWNERRQSALRVAQSRLQAPPALPLVANG
jgi:hypothetical protein